MDDPLRVVIADEDAPMRARVRAALEGDAIAVVGEGANAQDAIALASEHRPHVALLDVDMPGAGTTACSQIVELLPETSVVMLTASTDTADLFAALQSGAVGYLLKDMDLARLPATLRAVTRGEHALPRALVSHVIEEFRARGIERHRPVSGRREVRLTDREWEVLELLGEGLTTKEMADRLFVSQVTVRSHVAAILKKLQVPDRSAAVRLLRDL